MILVHPDLAEEQRQEDLLTPEQAISALDHILASRHFRSSNQCSKLLRYIVEHTLSGEDNLLRERVIGADVFGRPAGYEPGEDPVVRLRVAEVRKRLAQYYQASDVVVQIAIPHGGYRATLQRKGATLPARDPSLNETPPVVFSRAQPDQPIVVNSDPPLSGVTESSSFGSRRSRIAVGIILLVASTLALFLFTSLRNKDYRALWAPWRSSAKPVIISIGSNAVYRLDDEYVGRYANEHGMQAYGLEIYIPFKPNEKIPASELRPAYNSFVSTSDVAAISTVTKALIRQSIDFQERFSDDISFAELHSNPSILIGGFNNPMTVELTRKLPFVMRSGNEIDEMHAPNRKWILHTQPGARDSDDYAIVTRLVAHGDDAPMMSVAGLGGFGTQAAANLIADPRAFDSMVHKLPHDWNKKNLQVVLKVKASDFVTNSEVVAYEIW